MVEDVQEYVKKEETSRDDCLTEMVVNEKLLLDLQSGIATLYEKLKEIRLKPVSANKKITRACINYLYCFFLFRKTLQKAILKFFLIIL